MNPSVKINKCGMLILTLCLILFTYYFILNTKSGTENYDFFKNPNEINLRKLLIGCIQAAQKGGEALIQVSKHSNIHTQFKGDTLEGMSNPYTDGDVKSHCIMKHGLRRIFPRIEIHSEEDLFEACPDTVPFDLDPTVIHDSISVPDEIVSVSDISVWIDPLDATQEYTEKLHQYVTTMVCVAIKGEPIIGVIHNPFTGKTTWAWLDKAVSEDIENIKKDYSTVKNPIMIVSRSHAGEAKQLIRSVFGENTSIITAAGAGYKILQVIFNNATAYVHTSKIKKWDVCAGNAILNALNGKLTDQKNMLITYGNDHSDDVEINGLLASLNNHEELIKKILDYNSLIASPRNKR